LLGGGLWLVSTLACAQQVARVEISEVLEARLAGAPARLEVVDKRSGEVVIGVDKHFASGMPRFDYRDINFDGLNDLVVIWPVKDAPGATCASAYYDVFLAKAAGSTSFEEHDGLSHVLAESLSSGRCPAYELDAQAKHIVVYEQEGCCRRLEARYLIEGARAKRVSKDLSDALVALVERRKSQGDHLPVAEQEGMEPTELDDPDGGRILIRNKTSGEVWVVGESESLPDIPAIDYKDVNFDGIKDLVADVEIWPSSMRCVSGCTRKVFLALPGGEGRFSVNEAWSDLMTSDGCDEPVIDPEKKEITKNYPVRVNHYSAATVRSDGDKLHLVASGETVFGEFVTVEGTETFSDGIRVGETDFLLSDTLLDGRLILSLWVPRGGYVLLLSGRRPPAEKNGLVLVRYGPEASLDETFEAGFSFQENAKLRTLTDNSGRFVLYQRVSDGQFGFKDNERSRKIEWLPGTAHSPLKFRKGQYANVVIR
jgi:hypothetical protein